MSNCLKLLIIALFISACQTTPKQQEAKLQPGVIQQQTVEPIAAPADKVIDINQQNYEAGIAALKNNEITFAIELLEQATTSVPELEFAYTNLGLAYFKLEDFEKSEQAFQLAIKASDKDAVAYNHIGIIRRIHGEFDKAKTNYQKAISIDDSYAQAHLNLGILYDIYLQDLNAALRQYQQYQSLTNGENKSVGGWITDIQRQIKSTKKNTSG